jgi:hypothetical protein
MIQMYQHRYLGENGDAGDSGPSGPGAGAGDPGAGPGSQGFGGFGGPTPESGDTGEGHSTYGPGGGPVAPTGPVEAGGGDVFDPTFGARFDQPMPTAPATPAAPAARSSVSFSPGFSLFGFGARYDPRSGVATISTPIGSISFDTRGISFGTPGTAPASSPLPGGFGSEGGAPGSAGSPGGGDWPAWLPALPGLPPLLTDPRGEPLTVAEALSPGVAVTVPWLWVGAATLAAVALTGRRRRR